jgi:hypothetical protein
MDVSPDRILIMSEGVVNDRERPLIGSSHTKPGVTGRAKYRYLSRNKRASEACGGKGVLFSKRVNNEEVVACFVRNNRVIPCCSNQCCARLLGCDAGLFASCPTPEECKQRLAFVEAVISTRRSIHEKGQLESGKRLLARLRLGFNEGMTALPFASSYTFPGQRGASMQEYWWRTVDGACVQVRSNNNHCLFVNSVEKTMWLTWRTCASDVQGRLVTDTRLQ